MKAIVFTIIIALASVLHCVAEGSHTGEVFAEDVVITDAIIPANEYEKAIFRGNLTINSTVIGQQSFKEAIIVGDVTINSRIIAQEAFYNAVIVGELTVNDDANVDETAFVNENAGNVIVGNVTIENDAPWYSYFTLSPYYKKIILGDVVIKRSVLRNMFSGTTVIGNLDIERTVVFPGHFGASTIVGDVNINNSVVCERCFNKATICGELNCHKATIYKAFEEYGTFYETNIAGPKNFDESTEFISANCKFNNYDHIELGHITFSNDVVNKQAYDRTFYLGDITMENSIFEDNVFKQAVILGDLIVNNSVVHPSTFSNAIIASEIIADEASIFTANLPDKPSHTGEQFADDVVITDDVVGSGQYKGATFLGNLTIESRFIDQNAFENAIVLGNLSVKSEKIDTRAFNNAVVDGKLMIKEPVELIGIGAFYGIMLSTKSITLPASVIIVADQAFMNIGLTDIGIVDCHNLEKIGTQAFYGNNWKSLVFPLTIKPLYISSLAFGEELSNNAQRSVRNVYLPHHKTSNLLYGTPIGLWDNDGTIESVTAQDFMSANDIIYLWLNPDDLENSFPVTYGNWQLFSSSRSYIGTYGSLAYSLPPNENTYGKGMIYLPKGTKQALKEYLSGKVVSWRDPYDPHADVISFYPFFLYIPFENWIEIDMGEYPGSGVHYHGDINDDGSVDGGDVSILLAMVLSGRVSDKQRAVADLNGDGDVDGGDVSILLEMVLSGD